MADRDEDDKETSSADELGALTARFLEGAVTAEERARLQARLRADAEARRTFVTTSFQAAALKEGAAALGRGPRPGARFGARAAGGLLVAAAALALLWLRRPSPPTPAPSPSLRVAMLSVRDAPVWGPRGLAAEDGALLGPVRLDLRRGAIRLDFFSGAKVTVEGPALLELVSPWRAVLLEGTAAARVHEAASGFSMGAPGVTIYDVGTEFSISAEARGTSALRVFEGEVEASLIGPDGATARSQSVLAHGGARLDPRAGQIRPESDLGETRRVPATVPSPLPLSSSYAASVLASRPLGYWRFEREIDGTVPSEIPTAPALRLAGSARLRRLGDNGVAELPDGEDERFLRSTTPLEGIGGEAYAIELWANPETIKEMALVSLIRPQAVGKAEHKAFVSFMALSQRFLHEPGAIRFLDRWPPQQLGGLNVFSSLPYKPARWIHVVANKGPGRMHLWIDGVEVTSLESSLVATAIPVDLVVGRLAVVLAGRQQNDPRHFTGWVDELAIYDRALGREEIERHHALGRGPRR